MGKLDTYLKQEMSKDLRSLVVKLIKEESSKFEIEAREGNYSIIGVLKKKRMNCCCLVKCNKRVF